MYFSHSFIQKPEIITGRYVRLRIRKFSQALKGFCLSRTFNCPLGFQNSGNFMCIFHTETRSSFSEKPDQPKEKRSGPRDTTVSLTITPTVPMCSKIPSLSTKPTHLRCFQLSNMRENKAKNLEEIIHEKRIFKSSKELLLISRKRQAIACIQ